MVLRCAGRVGVEVEEIEAGAQCPQPRDGVLEDAVEVRREVPADDPIRVGRRGRADSAGVLDARVSFLEVGAAVPYDGGVDVQGIYGPVL